MGLSRSAEALSIGERGAAGKALLDCPLNNKSVHQTDICMNGTGRSSLSSAPRYSVLQPVCKISLLVYCHKPASSPRNAGRVCERQHARIARDSCSRLAASKRLKSSKLDRVHLLKPVNENGPHLLVDVSLHGMKTGQRSGRAANEWMDEGHLMPDMGRHAAPASCVPDIVASASSERVALTWLFIRTPTEGWPDRPRRCPAAGSAEPAPCASRSRPRYASAARMTCSGPWPASAYAGRMRERRLPPPSPSRKRCELALPPAWRQA
eukprot:361556-Chlamydomonas_euryale.AAC.5